MRNGIHLSEGQPVVKIFPLIQRDWACAQRRRRARVRILRRAQSSPANPPGKTKAIKPLWIVVSDTRAEDGGFPRRQRQLATVELFEDRLQTLDPFDAMIDIDVLPGKEKAIKILR